MSTLTLQMGADPHALAMEAEAAMAAMVGLLLSAGSNPIEIDGFHLAMLAEPIRQKLTALRMCLELTQDQQPNDDEVTKP